MYRIQVCHNRYQHEKCQVTARAVGYTQNENKALIIHVMMMKLHLS